MEESERLNEVLRRAWPAAWRCLSPLGRRVAFPRGIPFQAAEAKDAAIDATIGQLTDGLGRAMPLPALEASVSGLDPHGAFLYAPVEGPAPLRRAWGARERRLAGSPSVPVGLPFTSHGLTHALSLVADLFADPDTDVIVPSPAWENYELVFQLHGGARMLGYRFFHGDGFDVESLRRALASVRGKAILILNFPANPTGYSPTPAEAARIVEVVTTHPGPLVVVTDDAYQGWVYEDDRHPRSLFWDLAERADPERLLPLKVDGATKELVFFSSRIGFLTSPLTGEGEAALLSKLKTVVRGTVGCPSGPALQMVDRALRDPGLEAAFEERRALIGRRYRRLKEALATLDRSRMNVRPFNSAYFVWIELGGDLVAEEVRRRLLAERSVGVVAFPADNALRLAYCSIHEDRLPELVEALRAVGG